MARYVILQNAKSGAGSQKLIGSSTGQGILQIGGTFDGAFVITGTVNEDLYPGQQFPTTVADDPSVVYAHEESFQGAIRAIAPQDEFYAAIFNAGPRTNITVTLYSGT